ncbi:hypothetical protein BT96DRAFT_754297, partial [Gymnopus androsaceus JB14]
INRIFTVQILETDNVATLKEKIKEKNHTAFQHIDAHTLDLWNVSIPVEELSEPHLHDLQPARAPLLPVKKLRGLFLNTLPEEHLHIIVRPPGIAGLNCLVLGDQRNHIFPVEIAGTKSVGSLKEVIKEKKHAAFPHIDADALELWNVSEPVDQHLENNLEKANFHGKESLSPVDKLSKIFPNLPVEGCLHIVVWCP